MGLFDKKFCSVCGEKIKFLGNRKLEDGNLCGDCACKLSPWFEDRRSSTVDQINSGAYFTQALGHKGLGHRWRGNRLLKKVLSLKPDHLYANELLK